MKKCLVLALLVCLSGAVIGTAIGGDSKGKPEVIQAYYDGKLFDITLTHMPDNAAAELLEHNKSINTIYVVENSEEEEEDLEAFTPVLDAIQGDGFNPLWQEVRVIFPAGVTPFQLFSDDEILSAAEAGSITLEPQDEVYRCSVIGPKKK
ncbi:MAG: hypothetical protein M1376_24265 [Planctomycetes bacterium]|nr:hypothetical protein [Planctomycetota bacterium]